jgi:hypothetical protein
MCGYIYTWKGSREGERAGIGVPVRAPPGALALVVTTTERRSWVYRTYTAVHGGRAIRTGQTRSGRSRGGHLVSHRGSAAGRRDRAAAFQQSNTSRQHRWSRL